MLFAVYGAAWARNRSRALRELLIKHRTVLTLAVAVFASAVLVYRWMRRTAGFWTIDDSAITYSAAFELADHGSLAPFLEGTPIESYSNPLVFFVVVVLRWLGPFDPIATHYYIEAALFAMMTLLVWLLLRSLVGDIAAILGAATFALVELITPATWIWYGSGLENLWVSTGLVALVWLCTRTGRGIALKPAWGVIPGLTALTRPEAPVYVAVFFLALFALSRPEGLSWKAHARQVAGALAITAAVFIVFLVWRRLAYSAWLPNTYYAKVTGPSHLGEHFRTNVLGELFPYHRAVLCAGSALALMMQRKTEPLGQTLLLMIVAALVLPITADPDWMGEQRFGTAFLAMSHLAYGVLIAVCIAQLSTTSLRAWRGASVFTLVAVALVGLLLAYEHHKAPPQPLNPVTTVRIAITMGAQRWEDQVRLGLPDPVVLDPDIGGALLVGSMQLVDNAALADYQMARIGRDTGVPHDLRVIDQYETSERQPDIVNDNPAWPFNRTRLGSTYFQGADGLYARGDLVEAVAIPADAQLLYNDGAIAIYLSPDTVRVGAPFSLVRCELLVVWSSPIDRGTRLRAKLEHGDRDEIPLGPYRDAPQGVERRAVLLGAPGTPGTYTVSLSLERPRLPAMPVVSFTIDVTADGAAVGRTAAVLATSGSPIDAARRVAWLREQRVPRLGMTDYHLFVNDLWAFERDHSKYAGAVLRRLRDNARLATLGDLPAGVRTAEATVLRRVFATCPAGGADEVIAATRALCLGRTVDRLRRLGYLGVIDRVPGLAGELADLYTRATHWSPAQRYRGIVGYTLAKPSDIAAQNELLRAREAVAGASTFPPL